MSDKFVKNLLKSAERRSDGKMRSLHLFPICFVLFFCLFPALSVFSKTVAEYRKNIETAQNLTNKLLDPGADDAETSNYPEYQRGLLAKIRENISASEKIEFGTTEIEANNGDLLEKLDEMEKENVLNSTRSYEILSEIKERLGAIVRKLDELETSAAAENSKDENKRKLAEILRREEFRKNAEEKSLFQKIREAIFRWIASLFPEPKNVAPSFFGNLKPLSIILQILVYAVVLAMIGFLIYKFAPFLLAKFRRVSDKKEKTDRVILGEKLEAGASSKDIFSQAETLARKGNLREAIRKGYIALLCELSERKIIGLSRHKTNRDYLRDVRGRAELYRNMNDLTANFERYWYGLEDAETKDWEDFKSVYKKATTGQL